MDLGKIELIQRPKAEDEVAVAAASIIAREARESWIDWACKKFGFDLRDLSVQEAYEHEDRNAFAKVSYIKSEVEK